jgi:hypothetical protein
MTVFFGTEAERKEARNNIDSQDSVCLFMLPLSAVPSHLARGVPLM